MLWCETMPVSFYFVKPGMEPSEEVRKIFPIEGAPSVNVVAFSIEGGVLTPEELKQIDESLREMADKVDTTKPVIVTGRGPHWLYGVILHNLHFLPEVAVWDPRIGGGVIVHSSKESRLGMVMGLDGSVMEATMDARGSVSQRLVLDDNVTVLSVRILGDRAIPPKVLRTLPKFEAPSEKPLVLEGPMPIWLGGKLALDYVHDVPAIGVYDPRLKGGVVFATHSKEYSVGTILQIPEIKGEGVSATKTVAVVGDGDVDVAPLARTLAKILSERGYKVKLVEVGESREDYVSKVLGMKEEVNKGVYDFILVYNRGARAVSNLGVPTRDALLLKYVDGAVIVSSGGLKGLADTLLSYGFAMPDLSIYGAVAVGEHGGSMVLEGGVGALSMSDYSEIEGGKITGEAGKVVEEIAIRIARLEKEEILDRARRGVMRKDSVKTGESLSQ